MLILVLWAVGDKMNYLFEMKKSIHDYHCKHNQHCRAFAHISKKKYLLLELSDSQKVQIVS